MKEKDVPQKKNADGRYDTNYRYSDTFIRRATAWLVASIFIGPALGMGLAFGSASLFGQYGVPHWVSIAAPVLTLGGIGLPLVVGAWLGATAVNKYGGPVGLLLVFGIGALSYGEVADHQSRWIGIGVVSLVVSVVLLAYLGLQAKVPIWLQLPMANSPRLYVADKDVAAKKRSSVEKR